MSLEPVFSKDFYNSSLFQNGSRVGLSEDGRFVVLPKESRFSYLKRWVTFQQDPQILSVHEKLRDLSGQVKNKSGSLFTKLALEARERGEKKLLCLEDNLDKLRLKLDKAGQLNPLSRVLLAIVNLARRIFCLRPIEIKTFAKVEYVKPEVPWMSGYHTVRSFDINLHPIKQEALCLREEDKKTCTFSAEGSKPQTEERIQELEKGLSERWTVHQVYTNYNPPSCGTCQLHKQLEILFDQDTQQFRVETSAFLANHDIKNRQFRQFIGQLNLEERDYIIVVKYKDDTGTKYISPLICAYNQLEDMSTRFIGRKSYPLQPGRSYKFYDHQSDRLIFSLKLNKKE